MVSNIDIGDAFDTLAESDFWIDAAMVFAGFVAPVIAQNLTEGRGPDLPNELYGVLVVAANEAYGGQAMVSVGGSLYSIDALAQRLDVKQRVTDLGA